MDGKLIKTYGNPRLAFACNPFNVAIEFGTLDPSLDFKNYIYVLEHGDYVYKGIQ